MSSRVTIINGTEVWLSVNERDCQPAHYYSSRVAARAAKHKGWWDAPAEYKQVKIGLIDGKAYKLTPIDLKD